MTWIVFQTVEFRSEAPVRGGPAVTLREGIGIAGIEPLTWSHLEEHDDHSHK